MELTEGAASYEACLSESGALEGGPLRRVPMRDSRGLTLGLGFEVRGVGRCIRGASVGGAKIEVAKLEFCDMDVE